MQRQLRMHDQKPRMEDSRVDPQLSMKNAARELSKLKLKNNCATISLF